MTYRTEFPDFAPADMPAIPEGFADQSWRNDMCPSFADLASGLTLWVDYADPTAREFPQSDRFSLRHERYDDSGALLGTDADRVDLYEGDDWAALLAVLQRFRAPEGKRPVYFTFDEDESPIWAGFTDGSRWNGAPVIWVHSATRDDLAEHCARVGDDDSATQLVEAALDADWLIRLDGFTPTLIDYAPDEDAALKAAWDAA